MASSRTIFVAVATLGSVGECLLPATTHEIFRPRISTQDIAAAPDSSSTAIAAMGYSSVITGGAIIARAATAAAEETEETGAEGAKVSIGDATVVTATGATKTVAKVQSITATSAANNATSVSSEAVSTSVSPDTALPINSFKQAKNVCRNTTLTVDKNDELLLEGLCRDTRGKWWDTSLNLNRCISNEKGVLTWTQGGGFNSSCQKCEVFDYSRYELIMLTCNCDTGSEDLRWKYRPNSIIIGAYAEGPDAVRNEEGRFVCGAHFGDKIPVMRPKILSYKLY